MIESSSLPAYHYYALLPKKANRSPSYIFGVWAGIVASGVASLGHALFSHFSRNYCYNDGYCSRGNFGNALTDIMIPEAFEQAHDFALVDYSMQVSRRLYLE